MKQLAGKTAIISGGAEGIGLGIAKAMGRYGMNIVLADINADQLKEAEQSLQELSVPVLALPLDVAVREQWDDVARQAADHFGNIHMLVNNAGVGGTPQPIAQEQEKDWRWVVDVNLMGVVNGAHAVTPLIKQHGEGGWIINVASMAGFASLPLAGAYSATKAAVVALSECWHAEMKADNIHVSVLCPGFVKTRINLSDRNKQGQYQTDDGAGGNKPASNQASEKLQELGQQMQSIINAGTPPELIGERVVEALEAKELYIITHPNFRPGVEARFAGIIDAFKRAESSPLLADIGEQRIPNIG